MHGSLSIGCHHYNAPTADALLADGFVGLDIMVTQLPQEKIAGFIVGDSAQ